MSKLRLKEGCGLIEVSQIVAGEDVNPQMDELGAAVLSQCSLAGKILTGGQRQKEGANKSRFHLIISDIIWLFRT